MILKARSFLAPPIGGQIHRRSLGSAALGTTESQPTTIALALAHSAGDLRDRDPYRMSSRLLTPASLPHGAISSRTESSRCTAPGSTGNLIAFQRELARSSFRSCYS